jgi:hypothetical protein
VQILAVLAPHALRIDRDVEVLAHPFGDAVRHVVAIEVARRRVLHRVLDVLEDEALDVAALEDALAQAVEVLALVLHDLVVLEDVLADLEVALLDLALGALDVLGEPGVLDRVPLLHAHAARSFWVVSPANIFIRSSSSET